MSHGASFKDYSNAYMNITKDKNIIPAAALKTEEIRLREAQAEPQPTQAERTQKQLRQVGDIMRKVNGFLFLTCVCGLKLKVPPNFKADTVKCPRCAHPLDVAAQRRAKTS
jgi:heat shock protein HtpX